LKENPDVGIKTLFLDLASFDKVRAAAKEVEGWDESIVIDVLVNNAAVMWVPLFRRSNK
jgi:NAD(P)-dependent dehydrogenase (short-subunit alcohol dehydrogenase family)